MDEKKEKELVIPVNVPPKKYIVNGFGVVEFAIALIVTGIALIILIMCILTSTCTVQAAFISTVVVVSVIIFVRRDRYAENCMDKIKILIKYNKSQKKFKYEYFNIYERSYNKKNG